MRVKVTLGGDNVRVWGLMGLIKDGKVEGARALVEAQKVKVKYAPDKISVVKRTARFTNVPYKPRCDCIPSSDLSRLLVSKQASLRHFPALQSEEISIEGQRCLVFRTVSCAAEIFRA
jgi:hypothetical protein